MQRTFAAAFAALDDYKHKDPDGAAELGRTIQAHLRSSLPAVVLLDTGPIPTIEPCGHEAEIAVMRAEIEKLTAETETMRPAYLASLADEPECECSECKATP